MISEADDAEAFRKHNKNMRNFQWSHHNKQRRIFRLPDEMPAPNKAGNTGNDVKFFNVKGRPVIVPIWEIEPFEGSQN
jgi:hypothetical protein